MKTWPAASRLKIPGGEAEFSKEIKEAREKNEELLTDAASEEHLALPRAEAVAAPLTADDPRLALAKISPEAAIIEAFKDLERVLMENKHLLLDSHMPAIAPTRHRNLLEYVRDLQRAELISGDLVEQFLRVRQLRNLAVHPTGKSNISVGAAIEYRDLCESLAAAFRAAFARLEVLRQPG